MFGFLLVLAAVLLPPINHIPLPLLLLLHLQGRLARPGGAQEGQQAALCCRAARRCLPRASCRPWWQRRRSRSWLEAAALRSASWTRGAARGAALAVSEGKGGWQEAAKQDPLCPCGALRTVKWPTYLL